MMLRRVWFTTLKASALSSIEARGSECFARIARLTLTFLNCIEV
jgi:hypothetical protein